MARSSTSSIRRPEVKNDDYKNRPEFKILTAIENDDVDTVLQILDELKTKTKLTDNFLGMGLMRSSEKGKIASTRALLEAGAKPDSTTGNKLSPLLRAVDRDHAAIVWLLIDHGADPNVADKKGRTALMTAAWKNYYHTLSVLLQKGADINRKDVKGRNVLHNLGADKKCDWGTVIIALLLEQDIALDGPKGQDDLKRSPLHWACATGKLHLAELLLNRPRLPRADVHAVDLREKTSLHLAAHHGRDDIVELLINSNADVNGRSDGGWTPLHSACEKGSEKIVNLLLNAGADVNAKLLNGSTPLHLASQGGFDDVVSCLLEKREIKRAVRDAFGITPFLRAAQNKHKNIVNMLAPFNQVEFLSEDALGACNGFNATIVDFGDYHNENVVKRRTVFELLYGRDPLNHRKSAMSILPKDNKATKFRWIHLPANNMAWVEALLTKAFIEDGANDIEGFKALEKSFSNQHRGQQTHSHFMRPLCQSSARAPTSEEAEAIAKVAETPATPTIVINDESKSGSGFRVKEVAAPRTPGGGPSSADERSEGSKPHRGKDDHSGRGTPKDKGKKPQINIGGKSPKDRDRGHGKPYHGRHQFRSTSSTLSSIPKEQKQSARGNIYAFIPYLHFESDRRRQEMQQAISRAETLRLRNPPKLERAGTYDEMLIRAHLTSSNVSLHVRRTLDQSFYHNIDTTSRDMDQVVYRYQSDGKHPDPKIFMVDQLWMWVLGKDLIVTSFPQRWQQPKNDPLNVLDSIIEDINSRSLAKDFVSSVYDLSMIITARCTGVFDRHRMGDEDYQFLDMFESSIGNATAKETGLFKEFNAASAQASEWLQRHRRPNRFSRYLEAGGSKHDLDKSEEKVKFESLTRGPLFVDKLLDIGQETDLLAETKDIRDELNMIYKVLSDQLSVLPDVQSSILEIYENEQRSQSDVKKRFREQMKIVDMHIKDIERMDKQAERIYESVTDMLDLKQKHANAFEARFARDQAAGTARQSQTIMVFTIVTIIFLPLSFIAAFFAINISEFPHTPDGNNQSLPLGYVSKYLFGIGFAVSIPLIVVALSLDGIVGLYKEAVRKFQRRKDFLLAEGDGKGNEDEEEEALRKDTVRIEKSLSMARSMRRSVDSYVQPRWRGNNNSRHASPSKVGEYPHPHHHHNHVGSGGGLTNGHHGLGQGLGGMLAHRRGGEPEHAEFRLSTDLESGHFRR